MQAYRDTIDYMYSDNPQVFKDYAEFAGVTEAMAKRVRDEFFPKALVDPGRDQGPRQPGGRRGRAEIHPAPLTKEQLAELVKLQKPLPKR